MSESMADMFTAPPSSLSSTTRNNPSPPASNATSPVGVKTNLTQVKVDSQNTAFNLIVSFVGVAQRRGAFALDEAAKIFECIQMFKDNNN